MKTTGLIPLLLISILLMIGCAGTSVISSNPDEQGSIREGNLNLGWFRINYDESSESLSINPIDSLNRSAQIDVTKMAQIGIESMEWDPDTRNWTLDCWLKNPTSLDGYGIWVVFTELGEKKLIGQDGFIWIPVVPDPIRAPFIAVGKDQPLRIFPAHHQEDVTLVIHWPEGVEKWIPIEFFIDASWPAERLTPMVENMSSWNDGEPDPEYFITAWVADFQDTYDTLTVYADLSPVGGPANARLYDDGEHGDGDAGDSVFGCTFESDVDPGDYIITVYALDPAGNDMENDVTVTIEQDPAIPFIGVIIPEGGEVWEVGESYEIQWFTNWVTGTLFIEYSKDDFVSDVNLIASDVEDDGSFMWEDIPDDPSDTCKIRISSTDDPGVFGLSNGYFSIVEPSEPWIHVLTPNGGEVLESGFDYEVTWESGNFDGNVHIEYSKDDFVSDSHYIGPNEPNDGSFLWENVPDDPSDTVKVRIRSFDDPDIFDLSDDYFSIVTGPEKTITVIQPNGGEELITGDKYLIQWTSENVDGDVGIAYSTDNFTHEIFPISVHEENDGSYMWDIPLVECDEAWVRVISEDEPGIYDISDEPFSIIKDPDDPCQPFREILSGTHSNGDMEMEIAIRNADEWETFASWFSPCPDLSGTDWDEEMIIVLIYGERNSSGYYFEMNDICLDDDDVLHVDYNKWYPGPNCMVMWVFTQPYMFVRTDTYAGEIVFDKHLVEDPCDGW